MLLDGDRTSGMDVRNANVTAAVAIANIVKTSLGPVGLDKMLVDEIGGTFVMVFRASWLSLYAMVITSLVEWSSLYCVLESEPHIELCLGYLFPLFHGYCFFL